MQAFDAVVIGAGAAGLHCAGIAGQRGLKVLLIDHAEKVAEKIRISGGGRCNFTNRDTTPAQFLSANPHFCRSALARYTPQDFIALVDKHRIAWHEKHKGQLFCDGPSEAIIEMLLAECPPEQVMRWQPCEVREVRQANPADGGGAKTGSAGGFEIDTDRGPVRAANVVVATGGLSIPKIGASDFGLRLARQFGHRIVETRPALVPLTFDAAAWEPFVALAGLSLQAQVETGSGKSAGRFTEDLLFTHRGMSGPAILQISSFWRPGGALRIDLLPGQRLEATLIEAKHHSRRQLGNELAEHMPRRLADTWLAARAKLAQAPADQPLADVRDRDLASLARHLHAWELVPSGTEGYRKAEVTAGGVDTTELSSQTLQSRRVPGLYFIGEVVDVTGWLGGYNFQWAWASAAACARALPA
ncbi:MAG: membrane protein [Methylibium sp. NZG]|nr:MAG: membrane protein [Methylibium sp. NZG]